MQARHVSRAYNPRLCRTCGKRVHIPDGVAKASGGVRDGDRPVPHGLHLCQTARLEARRHQQDVAPSQDASRGVGVKTHDSLEALGTLRRQLLQGGLIVCGAAPQHHHLHRCQPEGVTTV